jgi:hypothetical protein
MTLVPFKNLLDLMSLGPERWVASLTLLAAFVVLNDLLRTALMLEFTRSWVVHLIINTLTLLPSFVLGLVLLYAGYRHPERAWLNLAWAALLYVAWYLGGTLTRLSRRDTEGADVGFQMLGALITLPFGILAVVLF